MTYFLQLADPSGDSVEQQRVPVVSTRAIMIELLYLNNKNSQGQPVTGNLKCFQKGRKVNSAKTANIVFNLGLFFM